MLTPGAEMSGLRWPSPLRGPPELKLANRRKPGLAMVVFVKVADPESAANRASPVTCCTPRNGIVTRNASPVSGFPVIWPSKGGKPAALLTINTAAAPAFWPNTARATRAQVPRAVTTSFPVTPAAVYSAGLQPSEIAPPVRSTTIGRVVPSVNVAPLALMAFTVLVADSFRAAPGNEAVESTAATLIAFSPEAGDPVMYGFGPLFPAEATTTTPASTALVDASALASSTRPKDEPRDMFTTCMWFLTAQSSASTTTFVDPVQPKTRTAYRSASGATPGPMRNAVLGVAPLYGPVNVDPVARTPKPAAVPATWLPCPLQSSGFGSGLGVLSFGSSEEAL